MQFAPEERIQMRDKSLTSPFHGRILWKSEGKTDFVRDLIASLCCHCSTLTKPPFGAGPPGCGKTLALNLGSCFRTAARGRSQRKRLKSARVLQVVWSGHVLLPISPVTNMPFRQTGGVCL